MVFGVDETAEKSLRRPLSYPRDIREFPAAVRDRARSASLSREISSTSGAGRGACPYAFIFSFLAFLLSLACSSFCCRTRGRKSCPRF